jgi:hypothetical protein
MLCSPRVFFREWYPAAMNPGLTPCCVFDQAVHGEEVRHNEVKLKGFRCASLAGED